MTAKGFAGSGAAREAVGTTEWPSATRQARPRRRSRSRTASTRTSCTAGASWRARATRRCVLCSTSSGSHCTGARGNARTSVLRRRIGGVECRIWVGSDLTSRRPADIRSALDDVRSRMGCSASRSTLVAAAAAGYVRSRCRAVILPLHRRSFWLSSPPVNSRLCRQWRGSRTRRPTPRGSSTALQT